MQQVIKKESTGASDARIRTNALFLPPHLTEKVAARFCWVAFVCAVTTVAMFAVQGFAQPEIAKVQENTWVRINALCIVLLSVGFIGMQWTGVLRPNMLVHFGLVFQVAIAFGIAIFEFAVPTSPDDVVLGLSWVAMWLAICGLVIPNTPLMTLVGALLGACMVPAAYYVSRWLYQYPPLPANRVFSVSFPVFLMAGWTYFLNRRVYQLEANVERVRDLGSYKLEELLGKGGMGEVWRATHRMLAREAAIKLVRPEVLVAQSGRQASVIRRRFEQEARATAALRSPHTVGLFDFGVTEDGLFYYAMELLDGIDFEILVKRFGPQRPERVVHFLREACDSLEEAHRLGLVHRDIKPTNLFSCRLGLHYDFTKVLDFGLVKKMMQNDESRMTLEGMTTGTPAYMSPEVAMGDAVIDGRSDLYCLACVGYWLLTGALVFEEPTPTAQVIAHVQKEPVPPSQRTELPIPPELERILMRCLAKKPEDRPHSAKALSRMLENCKGVGVWTRDDAVEWWQTNLPGKCAAALQAEAHSTVS
jgi:hypothetical protein